jgi:hypothetical protein
MFNDLKSAVTRSPATLAQDLAGAGAIFTILIVGLSWPGLG